MGSGKASRTAGITALLSSLALGILATASSGLAQSVPMPVPAPQPKNYGPAAPPRPPAATGTTQQQPARPQEQTSSGFPSIFKPPAIFGKSGEANAFDARQRGLADRVSAYLSGVRQLHGKFVQVGPDGAKSEEIGRASCRERV